MCIRYMYVVLVLLSIGLHFLWVYRPDNPIGMLGGHLESFSNHSPLVHGIPENYLKSF